MDSIFNYLCLGERKLSQEFRDYFTSGLERETERTFPLTYMELIDIFLKFFETSINYLYELPEEKFTELPENNDKKNTETLNELIQRISLHFLGHTGQIYWVKRELGKGGYFVTGLKKKNRDSSRIKWLEWWDKNKANYK